MIFNWPIFVYLLFGYLSNFLTSPSISYLSSSEKLVHFNPILAFFRTVVVILSWVLFVPRLGMFGFALGFLIGSIFYYIIVELIVFFVSHRKTGHQIVYYTFYIIFVYLLMFVKIFHSIYLLIIWSLVNIPLLLYGIIKTKHTILNKQYSVRYK